MCVPTVCRPSVNIMLLTVIMSVKTDVKRILASAQRAPAHHQPVKNTIWAQGLTEKSESCQKRQVVREVVSYLRSQFKLDLIHEYESIGVMWLCPAQKHPVLVALPGYRAGDVVSLFWKDGKVAMVSTEVWIHNSLECPENIFGFNIYQLPSVFRQNYIPGRLLE